MDKLVTQSDQWHRSQLLRQLKRLVRAVAVLGYCRHSDAIDAVAESITDVEQTLKTLSASPLTLTEYLNQLETPIQSDNQRLLIEAHTLLMQARSLINKGNERRFKALNVVEMRRDQADLADAAFERMLAASDVPSLYSSAAASESLCFGSNDSANGSNDSAKGSNSPNKNSKNSLIRKNKRAATHLTLVVDNSDSQSPASPGN